MFRSVSGQHIPDTAGSLFGIGQFDDPVGCPEFPVTAAEAFEGFNRGDVIRIEQKTVQIQSLIEPAEFVFAVFGITVAAYPSYT